MDKYERVTNVYARLDGKYEGRRQFGRHGHRWELLLQRVIQYKPTKCTFHKLIFYFLIFFMYSTCFEPEDSSSGRRLYVLL